MKILKALYKLIKPYAEDYKVYLPYQNNPIDLKNGYITFYEIGRTNIINRQEECNADESRTTITVDEVDIQINFHKYIDYAVDDVSKKSCSTMCSHINTLLQSRYAYEELNRDDFELANVFSVVSINGQYDENQKWIQSCNFKIKIYEENKFSTNTTLLENVELNKTEAIKCQD